MYSFSSLSRAQNGIIGLQHVLDQPKYDVHLSSHANSNTQCPVDEGWKNVSSKDSSDQDFCFSRRMSTERVLILVACPSIVTSSQYFDTSFMRASNACLSNTFWFHGVNVWVMKRQWQLSSSLEVLQSTHHDHTRSDLLLLSCLVSAIYKMYMARDCVCYL